MRENDEGKRLVLVRTTVKSGSEAHGRLMDEVGDAAAGTVGNGGRCAAVDATAAAINATT